MNRRNPTLRAWKAWTLFLLSFVAVGAPVWANTYVCPMEQAAIAERTSFAEPSGCCPKAEPTPGTSRTDVGFESPCDCAQLHWDVGDVDSPRSTGLASISSHWIHTSGMVHAFLVTRLVRLRQVGHEPVDLSSPPLWVRNLSILC